MQKMSCGVILTMLINFLALFLSAEAAVTPLCDKPMYHGPCKESHIRWFYNKTSGQCQTFTYGGCFGNDNRFENENDCENSCESEYANCKLPKDPGTCRYGVPNWYYDTASSQCESFIYGSCGGNANRFDSELACKLTCEPAAHSCTAPSELGHGRGSYIRWYYNSYSGQCETFAYSGYDPRGGGSNNRFNTRNGCEKACQ